MLDSKDPIFISGVYRTTKIFPGSGNNPNTKNRHRPISGKAPDALQITI